MRYKHAKRVSHEQGKEALDLKSAFVDLLSDVGVKKGSRTLADIYFDSGGDSLEELDRVLRMSGVSNPARSLIIRRWAQRVNKQVEASLLRSEKSPDPSPSSVFEAYERIRESDLKEVLLEDLRSRIAERRRKGNTLNGDFVSIINRLTEQVRELKSSMETQQQIVSRRMPAQPPSKPAPSSAFPCFNPNHSPFCMSCGRCGRHGSILNVRIGEDFDCPICGAWYFRDY